MLRNLTIHLFCPLLMVACAANPSGAPADPAGRGARDADQSNRAAAASPTAGQPVAYINGQPLAWSRIQEPLLEASGGTVLAELVLDQQVQQRLGDRSLIVTPALIDTERDLLARTFSVDADVATRLVRELRERRGLGPDRWQRFLARNAGLRLLVQDEVAVSDQAIQQAYQQRYGPRYEVRLIVVPSFREAGKAVEQARGGDEFRTLVRLYSVDPSRSQGGLLEPISPEDATYPAAVRAAMVKLEPGQVSDPIALEEGFAVIRLERKLASQPVAIEQVREELRALVRVQMEQVMMRRLARQLLDQAQVMALNPTLARSWKQQREQGTPEP